MHINENKWQICRYTTAGCTSTLSILFQAFINCLSTHPCLTKHHLLADFTTEAQCVCASALYCHFIVVYSLYPLPISTFIYIKITSVNFCTNTPGNTADVWTSAHTQTQTKHPTSLTKNKAWFYHKMCVCVCCMCFTKTHLGTDNCPCSRCVFLITAGPITPGHHRDTYAQKQKKIIYIINKQQK